MIPLGRCGVFWTIFQSFIDGLYEALTYCRDAGVGSVDFWFLFLLGVVDFLGANPDLGHNQEVVGVTVSTVLCTSYKNVAEVGPSCYN